MSTSVYGPVIIVGAVGGSNVGESLYRGAQDAGIDALICDTRNAQSALRWVNSFSWRLRDRRAPHGARLAKNLKNLVEKHSPRAIVSVGAATLEYETIAFIRALGIPCAHFSTDDPWNPSLRSRWYFKALKAYDVVFTPRRRNLADFEALKCAKTFYLPFAFDPYLCSPAASLGVEDLERRFGRQFHASALFVGGADSDRAQFFRDFIQSGSEALFVGGYWDRWPDLGSRWLGHRPPAEVLALTHATPINIILVRTSNRDGHTMRSFEAAAAGACLLVEDTLEHREIYGDDGSTVRYFSSPQEASHLNGELLKDDNERLRLSKAVQYRILNGGNQYSDRLKRILSEVDQNVRRDL